MTTAEYGVRPMKNAESFPCPQGKLDRHQIVGSLGEGAREMAAEIIVRFSQERGVWCGVALPLLRELLAEEKRWSAFWIKTTIEEMARVRLVEIPRRKGFFALLNPFSTPYIYPTRSIISRMLAHQRPIIPPR